MSGTPHFQTKSLKEGSFGKIEAGVLRAAIVRPFAVMPIGAEPNTPSPYEMNLK